MEITAELIGIAAQTIIFIVGGMGMVIRNDTITKTLKEDIVSMREELKGLVDIVTRQAVQDQRLNEQSRRMTLLEQRMEDLRKGYGWVQNRNVSDPSTDRDTIDREYP